MEISELRTIKGIESELNALLIDCVDSGASVGFLAPLSSAEACEYWQGVNRDLEEGTRKLFVIRDNDRVVGAVQLSLVQKPNGLHRAEVEKLMVHTKARGLGMSKKLMSLMELTARELGRSLLVLDTRLGDVASDLYRKIGYTEAGQIPGFVVNSSGQPEATVYFYKQL